MPFTTTDVQGEVVRVGDTIAYATTEFRSVIQKIYTITEVMEGGICKVAEGGTIGCVPERGVKLHYAR